MLRLTHITRTLLLCGVTLSAAALTACGGGGDGGSCINHQFINVGYSIDDGPNTPQLSCEATRSYQVGLVLTDGSNQVLEVGNGDCSDTADPQYLGSTDDLSPGQYTYNVVLFDATGAQASQDTYSDSVYVPPCGPGVDTGPYAFGLD